MLFLDMSCATDEDPSRSWQLKPDQRAASSGDTHVAMNDQCMRIDKIIPRPRIVGIFFATSGACFHCSGPNLSVV